MCAERKMATDCADVAAAVLAKYPATTLRKAGLKYDYPSEASPEDSKVWTEFRSRGYMTLSELKNLSRWKTGGRQQPNIVSNADEAVKAVTQAAAQVNSRLPNEPALSIGILTSLRGVDIPTASTIMTVLDTQRFGILDIRVWQALHKAAPSYFKPIESQTGNRRPFRPNEVALYLCVIREISTQTELSCRDLDKALWVLGGRA